METEMADNGKKKGTFYVVNKTPAPGATRHAIKTFLYNPETGEICGRTPLSWFKIIGFYLIFFTCLGLFSLGCFSLFWHATISEDRPRWTGADSLIGVNPGVGFRPMPDQDKNSESTLLWINREREKTSSYWADELDKVFSKNYNKTGGAKCDWSGPQATYKEACDIDLSTLPPKCQVGSGYGYTMGKGAPCVLVKLNKIFDWVPEPYTNNDDLKLAKTRNMPEKLQEKIKQLSAGSAKELNSVWITCTGENPADREHVGSIEYYVPGFKGVQEFGIIPAYYFPFSKQENYESPFVFVHFPKPTLGVLIQIECKAWAKNILADRFFRLGSVHFELMID